MNLLKKLLQALADIFREWPKPEKPVPPTPLPEPMPPPIPSDFPVGIQWLHSSPAEFKTTATLTNVRIDGKHIEWEWTHTWPVLFKDTGVCGNMWVIAQIHGKWYGATWEWLRRDTCRVQLQAKDGEPPFIQSKARPISEWYPERFEQIGFMVSTPCRGAIRGKRQERSPIYWTKWP